MVLEENEKRGYKSFFFGETKGAKTFSDTFFPKPGNFDRSLKLQVQVLCIRFLKPGKLYTVHKVTVSGQSENYHFGCIIKKHSRVAIEQTDCQPQFRASSLAIERGEGRD